MTKGVIKAIHTILVGGTYRHGEAYARASEVSKAIMIKCQADTGRIDRSRTVDPFMLAANYCSRVVNFLPFKLGTEQSFPVTRRLTRIEEQSAEEAPTYLF